MTRSRPLRETAAESSANAGPLDVAEPATAGKVRRPDLIDTMMSGRGTGFSATARLLWAGVWLVFLAAPISDILSSGYPSAKAVLAWSALAVFAILYMRTMWLGMWSPQPVDRKPYIALVALTVPLTVIFGGNWTGLTIYLGVATGWTLGYRPTTVILLALAGLDIAVGLKGGQSPASIGNAAFLTVALGTTMLGLRRIIQLVAELRAAREEVAKLAVAEARLRFSRDLHDVLGHSLSVVALKSQVARRLMTRDPGAAEAALTELEAVTHDSLGAVREMVTGYRQRSLTEELRGAEEVLSAAGITTEVARSAVNLPAQSDGLLAWAVREGVTNILRHSHAGRCWIRIDADPSTVRLEMVDDGLGPVDGAGGSGLRGLRERMAEVGGTLDAGPGERAGFRLRVTLPATDA